MANNAIPDSIIMNTMTRRSLIPPVVPKVRSTEVGLAASGLTSKNTLTILNTINPIARAFTAMDEVKAVRVTGYTQARSENTSWYGSRLDVIQVTRSDKS